MKTRRQMMRSAAIQRVLARKVDRSEIGSLNDLRRACKDELAANGPEIAAEIDRAFARMREIYLRIRADQPALLFRPMPAEGTPAAAPIN